ncbi:MAG: Lrp/AsnC family transcriptional regulator [SAR202 cluster bacterium]|jgi:Lrp/AsnC family transcriptional regulator for asnA, asnC and gidA|nr:Lrp/AsnC family transcriptional regulator [SAR202 cluster bacterium]MDP6511644.1 Lrp/AsnC family transcriptional regulator [SAR202 cluster bacterium]MDP6713651.1 Lrp/AsnC family transcriptional regulator [SAR202 cluster bacterium]
MDQLDITIISMLQQDGTATNAEIAKHTGVSEETVRRRRGRLVRDGYMRIVGVPNPSKLGFEVQAMIALQVDADKLDSVAEEMASMDEVTWVVISTGSVDVFAWTVLRTIGDLSDLLSRKISLIEGVRRTETFVSISVLKESLGVRMTPDED